MADDKKEGKKQDQLSDYNQITGFKEREPPLSIFDIDFFRWAKPRSKDLFGRVSEGASWLSEQKKLGFWLYNRTMLTGPATEVLGNGSFNVALDDSNNAFYGVNFASADYLGLAQNEAAKEAAINAAREFGCNSAGSPLAFGATKYFQQLREQLADYWKAKAVIIYSAGWLAGFGVIKGLIRDYDHVIMDNLSHNCLQEGANAATKNVVKFPHLDTKAMEAKLKAVREKDPDNAILVVTEGLFSMDSDTPNLNEFQQITKKYDAFMLLDCAHDFGCMGPGGRGTWELQGLKDRSNVILMGTGSKTLSTNIGFVACDDPNVIEYLKVFSSAYMFTNAINPVQAATSLANLRILNSQHGNQLRRQVLENYKYLRAQLEKAGHTIYGNPCPILPLKVGNEIICRFVSRLMMDEGIHVNGIEFPVVSIGQARLRVNLMPQHTKAQLDLFVTKFESCLDQSKKMFDKMLERLEQQQKQLQPKL